MNIFVDETRRIRSGWWILLFFFTLAALLIPLIVLSSRGGWSLTPQLQAMIILAVSIICQALRRRPMSELFGQLESWGRQLAAGCLIGASLMAVPALLLAVTGTVSWSWNPAAIGLLPSLLLLYVGVAVAEELMFRGFAFQRLIDGLGVWPAQLIVGVFFVLTHSAGLKTAGELRLLASVNIFIASLMFGVAYVRTSSLALPIGLHFAANVMQGPILGFGVSGNSEPGFLTPSLRDAPSWLTGGSFGLEASLPGLVCVCVAAILLYRWRRVDPMNESGGPKASAALVPPQS